MEKRPGSYAVFDVAKAPLLALMSDWRRDNAKLGLDGSLQGVFARCEDAETATFETWRAGDAKSARLLSLFSHGSAGTLEGCTKAPLYVEAECATYPEVPGAVIHLLACESLLELAPALVAAGADAVIGYSEPFALVYTPADADEIAQGRLPASIASALACDNQVLLALAGGESVASAVEAAKSWAASEGERLAAAATQVRLTEDGLRAFAARQANLATNASFLGYCGHAEATITVTGRTQTMSNARTLLLYLVADLMRAEVGAPIPKFDNLIEDFKKDPEKVMTAYGVDDDARVVLFTMDRQLIGEYLRQEVLRTPAPPPVSLWAEPLPRIQSVEPKVLVTAQIGRAHV